jgi:hypothetical protein
MIRVTSWWPWLAGGLGAIEATSRDTRISCHRSKARQRKPSARLRESSQKASTVRGALLTRLRSPSERDRRDHEPPRTVRKTTR